MKSLVNLRLPFFMSESLFALLRNRFTNSPEDSSFCPAPAFVRAFAGSKNHRLDIYVPEGKYPRRIRHSPSKISSRASLVRFHSLCLRTAITSVLTILLSGFTSAAFAEEEKSKFLRVDNRTVSTDYLSNKLLRDETARSITFSNCILADQVISLIGKNKFTSLTIIDCHLTPENLSELGDLQSLTSLALYKGDFSDLQFPSSNNLSRLESLVIRNNNHINGSLLKKLPCLENIKTLDFTGTAFSDENLPILKKARNLEDLTLYSTKVSGKAFLEICPLPKLKDLNADFCKNSDDWFFVLAKEPLVDLSDYSHINPIGCLSGLSDAGLQSLNRNYERLWHLDLSNSKVTANGLRYLYHFPHLIELDLSSLRLSGAELSFLKNDQWLRVLRLNSDPITYAGLECVSNLNRLSELSLVNSLPPEPERLNPLCKSELSSLELSHNHLNKQDFGYLRKMRSLKRLVLNDQKIEIWQTEEISRLKNLRVLNLQGTTGLSKEVLKPLIRMRKLRYLDTFFSDITPTTKSWLREKMSPSCNLDSSYYWRDTVLSHGRRLKRGRRKNK